MITEGVALKKRVALFVGTLLFAFMAVAAPQVAEAFAMPVSSEAQVHHSHLVPQAVLVASEATKAHLLSKKLAPRKHGACYSYVMLQRALRVSAQPTPLASGTSMGTGVHIMQPLHQLGP